MQEQKDVTNAQILAGLLNRTAEFRSIGAAIQRSHRFPASIFWQIENMAKMADVSISTIINQLLECGLEAVKENLSEEQIREIQFIAPEQLDKPFKTVKDGTKERSKK